MTINQLSIFIENRSGTLVKVLDILKNANIQIVASTIADTAEYGIVPGRAADAVRIISNADISITYMYTFLFNGKGILIFRTDNTDAARETIILNSLKFIGEKDLTKWV